MKSPKSLEIAARFWQSIDALRLKHGRGFQSRFIDEAGSNIGHFLRLRREPGREFEPYFLALAVRYGISADWLLTGRGEMMAENKVFTPDIPTSVPTKKQNHRYH